MRKDTRFARVVFPSILGSAVLLGLQGCISYVFQNSNLRGPRVQSLPNITEGPSNHRLRIRPFVQINQSPAFRFDDGQHSRVDSTGNYTLIPYPGDSIYTHQETGADTIPFRGYNTRWSSNPSAYGVQLNFQAFRNFSLAYGIQASVFRSEVYLSHTLGWGFGRTLGGVAGIRLDMDVSAYPQHFDADMLKRESGYSSGNTLVLPYRKTGDRLYFGSSIRITANSLNEYLHLNYFASLEDEVTKYFGNSVEFTGLSLGAYKNFSKRLRWLGGVRALTPLSGRFDPEWQFSYYSSFDIGLK